MLSDVTERKYRWVVVEMMEWVEIIGMKCEETVAVYVPNGTIMEDSCLYTSELPRR